jgi:hypothetical protein
LNEGREREKAVVLTVQRWGTHCAKQGAREKDGQDLNLASSFSASETMIFGRGNDPSEAIKTANKEGGLENMTCDETRFVEGMERIQRREPVREHLDENVFRVHAAREYRM